MVTLLLNITSFGQGHLPLNQGSHSPVQPDHNHFKGSTTSLGNVFQCLPTLIVKTVFLMSTATSAKADPHFPCRKTCGSAEHTAQTRGLCRGTLVPVPSSREEGPQGMGQSEVSQRPQMELRWVSPAGPRSSEVLLKHHLRAESVPVDEARRGTQPSHTSAQHQAGGRGEATAPRAQREVSLGKRSWRERFETPHRAESHTKHTRGTWQRRRNPRQVLKNSAEVIS